MKRLIFIILSLLLVTPAWSAPTVSIETPNSFVPNTTIESSRVNSNFIEIQNQYNTHSHTDLTSIGTITSGSWNATPIGTQYGGTGEDFSSGNTGAVLYFSDEGEISTLGPGVSGQYLRTRSGGTTPAWETAAPEVRDILVYGLEVNYHTADTVSASPGVVFVGTTGVATTAAVLLDLTIGGIWSSSSIVNYTVEDWNYVGVKSDGNFRLLGNNPPEFLNESGDSVESTATTTMLYSLQGSDYYRVIGAFKQSGYTVARDWKQIDEMVYWDIPIILTNTVSDNSWSDPLSANIGMPEISKNGMFGLYCSDNTNQAGVWIRPNGGTWSTGKSDGVTTDIAGASTDRAGGQRNCFTDSFQQIQYFNDTGDDATSITIEGYILNIR